MSEDLDFSANYEFSHGELNHLTEAIKTSLYQKYGFDIEITDPKKDEQNVKTWKIKIETSKKAKHLPKQRINLDICSISSHTKQPMIIKNHYGINFGTSGLVLSVISQEELFTDKLYHFPSLITDTKFHRSRLCSSSDLIPLPTNILINIEAYNYVC